jgi:hypothetical protein
MFIRTIDANRMSETELARLLDELFFTPVKSTPVKKRAKVRRKKAYNKAYNQALDDVQSRFANEVMNNGTVRYSDYYDYCDMFDELRKI